MKHASKRPSASMRKQEELKGGETFANDNMEDDKVTRKKIKFRMVKLKLDLS